jgi:uncharacterized integral membrane protein
MNGKLLLTLLLSGIVIMFVIQNMTIVHIRFFLWTLSVSGSLLFILLFTVGAVFGWLLHGYSVHRKKSAKRL